MTTIYRLTCLAFMLSVCLPLNAEEAETTPAKSESESSVLNVFEGMQSRQIEVKLTQKSEKSGTLFLRNPTKESVTVQFPESFVGIHVTNPNFIAAGANGQAFPQRSGASIAQSTGNSINFPSKTVTQSDAPEPASLDKVEAETADPKALAEKAARESAKQRQVKVPAGKTIQLPVTSVCLEYGKPEPNSKMAYLIIPVERYSRNPILHELLPLFAKRRISQKTAQAAAWHVSNGLTWVELSSLMGQGPVPVPMFNRATLQQANLLVNEAKAIAVQRQAEARKKPADKPRTDRTRRQDRTESK